MAEKKSKKIWILLGVLLVLVLCYIGIQMWNKKQDEKKTQAEKESIIYMTDISDVTAVKYDGGQGALSFKKEGDNWYSEDDLEFPLNTDLVKTTVDAFCKLEAQRELKDGDDLSSYGLDQPTYYISLTDQEGNVTTVNIGNAVDENYYAMVGEEGTVYTISASDVENLQNTLEDMALLDTFPDIGSGNIISEEIEKNGNTTKYEADNEVDTQSIATVVGGLSVISLDTVENYHMSAKDATQYGLDEKARTTVIAKYKDDDKKEQMVTFYIGKEDGDGNQYVQLDSSNIVYKITSEICNNILNKSTDSQDSKDAE